MATTGVTLASGNRVKHAKIRETAFGVIPTSPAFFDLRVTSSTLQPGIDSVVSQELRTDRQIPDQTTTAIKASGDLSFELSFNAMDGLFEEVLQGTWSNKPNIVNTGAGTPISALSATTLTVGSGLGTPFYDGAVVQLSGFAAAANNTIGFVTAQSSTTIVCGGSTFTVDASPQAGATVRIVGAQIASGDLVATSSGLTATAADFTTLGLSVGDWIKLGSNVSADSFATAANNAFVRVTQIAAHAISLDNLPAGWAADSGTGKAVIIWFGDTVINGVNLITSTIERTYTDQGTPTYEYYTGSVTSKMSLSLSASQIITGSASFVSQSAQYPTTRASGASDIAAPTYPVLNATSNFGGIDFAGAALLGPNYIMEATVDFDNSVTPAMAVGSLGAVAMINGDFNVTGTLNAYFGSNAMITYLLGNQATALNFRIGDTLNAQETYIIDLPQVKLTSTQINDVSKNKAVMQSIGYRAVLSPTLGYTAKICRFWYHQ